LGSVESDRNLMMIEDLVIFGSGAVGRLAVQFVDDVNRYRERWRLLGFRDEGGRDVNRLGDDIGFLGDQSWLRTKPEVNVIVCIAEPRARKRIVDTILRQGHERFATIVHPLAWIGSRVKIGAGSLIYPGVLIDVDVEIGSHNILNKAATVGHDTIIGDYTTISPGVNIGGNVSIGEGSEFGINCSTVQRISIGSWVRVGAGGVVIKDLPDSVTAVGVPARIIKYHKK